MLRRVPLLQQFGDFAQAHSAATWQDLPAHVEPFTAWWARRRGQPTRRPATHAKLVTHTRSTVEQMLQPVVPGFTGRGRPHRGEPFLGRTGAFFQELG